MYVHWHCGWGLAAVLWCIQTWATCFTWCIRTDMGYMLYMVHTYRHGLHAVHGAYVQTWATCCTWSIRTDMRYMLYMVHMYKHGLHAVHGTYVQTCATCCTWSICTDMRYMLYMEHMYRHGLHAVLTPTSEHEYYIRVYIRALESVILSLIC